MLDYDKHVLNDSCLERICWQKTVYWHWLILKWHILWFIVAIYFYAEHHLWFLWFNMSSNIARPFAWSDTVITNFDFNISVSDQGKGRAIFGDTLNQRNHKCSNWKYLTTMNQGICTMLRESQCQYSFLQHFRSKEGSF